MELVRQLHPLCFARSCGFYGLTSFRLLLLLQRRFLRPACKTLISQKIIKISGRILRK